MLRQQLAPVRQKLRVIVLAHVMRFQAGPNINMHSVGVLSLRTGNALGSGVLRRYGHGHAQEKEKAEFRCHVTTCELLGRMDRITRLRRRTIECHHGQLSSAWLLLIAPGAIWGASFLFIAEGLRSVGPF